MLRAKTRVSETYCNEIQCATETTADSELPGLVCLRMTGNFQLWMVRTEMQGWFTATWFRLDWVALQEETSIPTSVCIHNGKRTSIAYHQIYVYNCMSYV